MFSQPAGSGYTVWFTGMQGAGKRTVAMEVANRLRLADRPVEVLAGDDWEIFIGKGPGATPEERNAVVRRAGFLARAITRAGGFALVPMVSPYREARDVVRREIGRFMEVFVDCPTETLMARDRTGLYLKALRGEIRNFIGVTDPYEPPAAPEVRIDTSRQSIDEAAAAVIEALVREGALQPGDAGMTRRPRKADRRAGKRPAVPPPPIRLADTMALPPRAPPRSSAKAAETGKPTASAPPPAAARPAAPAPKPATEKQAAKPAPAPARTPEKPKPAPAKALARPAPAPAKAPAPEKIVPPKPPAAKPAPDRSAKKTAPAAKPAKISKAAAALPPPAAKQAQKSAPQKVAARTARASR